MSGDSHVQKVLHGPYLRKLYTPVYGVTFALARVASYINRIEKYRKSLFVLTRVAINHVDISGRENCGMAASATGRCGEGG